MRLGAHHMRDHERLQRLGGVGDALDLEADGGQRVGDRVSRGGGVEMVLEPVERELHFL
jgi:hypothetical protein